MFTRGREKPHTALRARRVMLTAVLQAATGKGLAVIKEGWAVTETVIALIVRAYPFLKVSLVMIQATGTGSPATGKKVVAVIENGLALARLFHSLEASPAMNPVRSSGTC